MANSVGMRAQLRDGFDRVTGRAGFGALALTVALAGCVQPGAFPGTAAPAAGTPGAAAPAAPAAPGATAGAPATPGMTVPGLGRVQLPYIQWPRPAGQAGATAQAQVTDPFAGQGVLQPGATAGGTARAAAAAPAVAPAQAHTVAAGETAWSVARRYGITVQDLARANGLPETMSVRVGQRLTIPARTVAAASNVVTAPGVGSATPRPPSAAQPLPGEQTRPASAPAPAAQAPNLGSTRTAASGTGTFAMPVSGSIMRAYKKGTNEGIDISAAPGSPIKAAGGGTVAAVTRDTDGVPIVVVRHDNGLMTVYAGVDKLSVGKGDSVSRGQSIGATRNSGVLHFEVRNGFESVDPEDHL